MRCRPKSLENQAFPPFSPAGPDDATVTPRNSTTETGREAE